jgi:tol-pal system protein YbgF
VTFRRFSLAAPLAVVLTAGCFATRNDVRVLQADIVRMNAAAEEARRADAERARTEQARRDSIHQAESRTVATSLRMLTDTMFTLSDMFSRFKASQVSHNYEMGQLIAAMQEKLGASQQAITAMRARIEAQRDEAVAGGAPPGRGDTSSAPGTPRPRTMYQSGLDQLQKGASGTARMAFQEFLTTYPNDSLVPDVMYQLGEAYAADKMDKEADSVRVALIDKYPKSPSAPRALYKRAVASEGAGRTDEARKLYDRIIADYKGSDVFTQAQNRRRQLPGG